MTATRTYDPHRKWEPRNPPKPGEGGRTSAMIASLAAEGYETVSAPFGHALVADGVGPIPARAGQPTPARDRHSINWAYPRSRGATPMIRWQSRCW